MIATNALIPPRGYGGKRKYPWHTMEVGDHFVHESTERTARTHATTMNRRWAPKHWACRKTTHGVEVWREK